MSEITANEFLDQWKDKFIKKDENEYLSKIFFIPFSSLYDATGGAASNINEFKKILKSEYSDDLIQLHNSIMGFIFGGGENFQGSYEGSEGVWFLDFGKITIRSEQDRIKYSGIRFYIGDQ
tara:strand:- start:637 stop:999 length:363 start_codon:yes stop_codon:yes gene_type:complete